MENFPSPRQRGLLSSARSTHSLSARSQASSKKPRGRPSDRVLPTRRGKENESQQTQPHKREKVQDTRRMMMELTDLRAKSRELREINKRQKADKSIGERLADQQLRELKDQLRQERDTMEVHKEENRVLKQKLSLVARNQGAALSARLSQDQTADERDKAVAIPAASVALVQAGDGDASGGGERKGPWSICRTSPVPTLAATAGAAAAAGAAMAAATKAQERMNVGAPGRGAEVPRLSLGSRSAECVATCPRLSPSVALQQLREGSASPHSRERFVQIIEEHVSALRQELEELRVFDNAQATTSRTAAFTSEGSVGGSMPSARTGRSMADSARGFLRETQTHRSCNSARDSVHSHMTRDSVHTKLDKMNDHIHGMLIAGTATVAETEVSRLSKNMLPATLCNSASFERREAELGSLSPASVGTTTTSAGCAEIADSSGQAQSSVMVMGELDRVSQYFAHRAQEVDGVKVLQQQLVGQENENKALRNRLRQVESAQLSHQMEMQALRQALRSARGTETSGSSFGGGAVSAEDSERVWQPSSPQSPISIVTTSRPSYCWPPAAPLAHWTWQRNGDEHRNANANAMRGRAVSGLRRSISMGASPAAVRCARMSSRTSSLAAPLGSMPLQSAALPAHSSGSSNWWLEGSSAYPLPSNSATASMLRKSASVPGMVALPTAAAATNGTVGNGLSRARSSSPLCRATFGEPAFASAAFPAPRSKHANTAEAPPSRSPSPMASVAVAPGLALSRSPSPVATPVVPTRQTDPPVLVKIRDSPPRRVSPGGSIVQRSHWRLMRKGLFSDRS